MKLTNKMFREAADFHQDHLGEYDYDSFSIRVQEEPFEMGKINHVSSVWENGEETGKFQDGVSATSIEMVTYLTDKELPEYYGDHAAIIAGKVAEWENEVIGDAIIKNAVVLKILA